MDNGITVYVCRWVVSLSVQEIGDWRRVIACKNVTVRSSKQYVNEQATNRLGGVETDSQANFDETGTRETCICG